MVGAQARECREQLRDALALVQVPEAADERTALDRGRRRVGQRPGGMRDPPDRPVEAGLARAALDVAGVDDQAGGGREHVAGERELLRPRLPERRDAALDDPEREQAPGEAVPALHRVEVAPRVAAGERQSGDEVVEHELVQDDDAGPRRERLRDPAVGLRVVADVVEREVRGGKAAEAPPAARRHDLDPLRELGQEQRAVVGHARPRRRQRRVVGDLHASSLSIALSQVTCSASALPARPQARASSSPIASAAATAVHRRLDDAARLAVADDVERPAGIGRRHHRLLGQEGLERDHPEVLVDRRVEDRAAAGVEVCQLRLGDAAGEADAPVREPLEPLAVRPLARDDERRRPASPPPRSAGRSASRGRGGRRRRRTARMPPCGRRAPAAGAGAPRRPGRSSAAAGRRRSGRSRTACAPRRAPTRSSRCTRRRVARSSADSENCPSSVRSSS